MNLFSCFLVNLWEKMVLKNWNQKFNFLFVLAIDQSIQGAVHHMNPLYGYNNHVSALLGTQPNIIVTLKYWGLQRQIYILVTSTHVLSMCLIEWHMSYMWWGNQSSPLQISFLKVYKSCWALYMVSHVDFGFLIQINPSFYISNCDNNY